MKAILRRSLTTLLLLPLMASSADAQRRGQSYAGCSTSIRATTPVRSVQYPHRAAPHRQQVWIAGYWDRVWVEPRYELRRSSCGGTVRVLVRAGYWNRFWRPGHYQLRTVYR